MAKGESDLRRFINVRASAPRGPARRHASMRKRCGCRVLAGSELQGGVPVSLRCGANHCPAQGRRHATWFEQHFPEDELTEFAARIGEGLLFALCSIRAWLMIFITCVATLLCSPGATDNEGKRGQRCWEGDSVREERGRGRGEAPELREEGELGMEHIAVCVCLGACICVCVCVYLFFYVFFYPAIYTHYTHLSIHPSIYLSHYVCICVRFCVFVLHTARG
jgi:hypothetical protein